MYRSFAIFHSQYLDFSLVLCHRRPRRRCCSFFASTLDVNDRSFVFAAQITKILLHAMSCKRWHKTLEILRLLFIRSKVLFCVTLRFNVFMCKNKNSLWLKHKHEHSKWVKNKMRTEVRGREREWEKIRAKFTSWAVFVVFFSVHFPHRHFIAKYRSRTVESTNKRTTASTIAMKNYRIAYCSLATRCVYITTEAFQSCYRPLSVEFLLLCAILMTHRARNGTQYDQIWALALLYVVLYNGAKTRICLWMDARRVMERERE